MNQMNMAGMNPAAAGMAGGMPMMANMPNGAMPKKMGDQEDSNYDGRLNLWIYGYFIDRGEWDLARAMKNSNLPFVPSITNSGDEINGMNDDLNDADNKRPDDLPDSKAARDEQGGSMLLGWFSLFWDMYAAQRRMAEASKGANHLMEQTRLHRQGRENQISRTMSGMMPTDANVQAMMRMNNMNNNDLRQKAMQNQQQNGMRGPMNQQQMLQIQRTMMQQNHQQQQAAQQQQQQQQMRRDPSTMDINGLRPRTPGSGDHAPSPSKRARMDGTPFGQHAMMQQQNGRPNPGMQPGMTPENAQVPFNALLAQNGINPANLSESQYASFQQQAPLVQQKSIQAFANSLQKNQRDGAMDMAAGGQFFGADNAQLVRNGSVPQGVGPNGGNAHALQDYQMQLMLLEQQNKKRLLMARQEADVPTGFVMSPSDSRGGPSPGPNAERRNTPKLLQQGMEGSPLADGSMRSSPGAMFNTMPPEMYANGMRPPPNSNPATFNGAFNPQMEALRQRMPNGGWQPGQVPVPQQGPNLQQPQAIGTPQQRNDMPPPQGPPPGATNGRQSSDDNPTTASNTNNPPTPQPANKTNPKTTKKKGDGKAKQSKAKQGSGSVAATPAAETENPPATPTPSTPITPSHPNSFNGKAETGQANASTTAPNGAAAGIVTPQPEVGNIPQFNGAPDGTDQGETYNMNFSNDLVNTTDVMESFDFDQFLETGAFSFDPAQFEGGEMLDAPMNEAT